MRLLSGKLHCHAVMRGGSTDRQFHKEGRSFDKQSVDLETVNNIQAIVHTVLDQEYRLHITLMMLMIMAAVIMAAVILCPGAPVGGTRIWRAIRIAVKQAFIILC